MEECYDCKNDLILEGKNKPNDPEKWSACKSAAKSKFDVYPSAYANAWAAKCYKKKGGTWRSVKEETQADKTKKLIKENIIGNFMENAKPEFTRRGAEKQRPKSWNKGTKSGSEKRKMREQGKQESRDIHESKGQVPFKPEDPMSAGAMDKALADAVSRFSGEGVAMPARMTPRVQDILKKEMEWRRGIDNLIQTNRGGYPVGHQTPEQVQEDLTPEKRWELYQELKHEDNPNYAAGLRQDRQIARMNANAKWAVQRLMPVYEKHGMAEEHASVTDQYGFPSYGHAITHPNFRGFVDDFIAFHTAENQKHWQQYGKASSYHWPAILRAKQGLESLQRHEEYMAKQKQIPGDLSESIKNKIINSLLENSKDVGDWAGLGQDEMTHAAYEQERRESDSAPTPISHTDMAEKIKSAHDAALSHVYTSHTMGKHKGKDSEHMLNKYIKHFREGMGIPSSD